MLRRELDAMKTDDDDDDDDDDDANDGDEEDSADDMEVDAYPHSSRVVTPALSEPGRT
jgi:hypothetical protein